MTGPFSRLGAALPALSIALALCTTAMPARAAGLGRLFFTPEQRASLERQRGHTLREIRGAAVSTLSLGGVVRRSGGKSTVWINGVAHREGGSAIRIDLASQDYSAAAIKVDGGNPIRLRVGESVERATRERQDALAGGSIAVDGKVQ